ncbi:MAG TPA: hypothetical protein VGL34_25250 [Steroidobacteraceae bacterium]
MRYRKKPVEIDAIRWEGGDYKCLEQFCGFNWGRADAKDVEGPRDKEGVVVWNIKEDQWLNLPVGHWLIRGIAGELYPCAPDVFDASYEAVTQAQRPGVANAD